MYISKLPYIIYRDYPEYGFLSDNRNFGYDTAAKSCVKLGERIISKSGSIFYSVLSDQPQSLDEIANKLMAIFPDIPLCQICSDAEEFYKELSMDGFVHISNINHVLIDNSNYFSYSRIHSVILDKEEKASLPNVLYGMPEYRLIRVHIDISSFCNEKCVHCYIPKDIKKHIMSRELFNNILDQCIENKVINVTISGGEPMMNPNILQFISRCRDNNMSVNLLSNLTLLSDRLLEEFKRNPLLSIQTSLYSMDAKTHDSITGIVGSFHKTKKAIEKLCEHNIPMQINCPIMRQNKDNYKDVLIWAHSLNIEASSDYMLFGSYDCSRSNLQNRLNIAEIEDIIKRSQPQDVDEAVGDKDEDSPICSVCSNSICISNIGEVYPCEGWQHLKVGNIKTTPLKEIWENSSTIKELRGLKIKDFPECVSCVNKAYCSICLIRNANESVDGNYREINPYFCKIAQIKKLHCLSK